MLDVFFLSYNETFADKNYQKLLEKAPLAKRVHGVKGFYEAHKRCAELSMTSNFYVVDADAILVDDFEFNYTPSKINQTWGRPESEIMYVWSSQNPINDLVYGYGGVKLIPKLALLESENFHYVDFTTSAGIATMVMNQVSNITAFNTDEFSTWRAAFRECVKLSTSILNFDFENIEYEDAEKDLELTKKRLDTWCNVGAKRKYGKYALHGATKGKEYGIEFKDDRDKLAEINNFEWMTNEFNKFFR